jgi:hypothetical protein
MYPFYQEQELIKPVVDYFRTKGWIVKREIQIGFCRADVVAFKKKTVTAVELKLTDWKKALIQAKNYQLGADYVYLAVPLMNSYTIMRKAEPTLHKEGIGVLTVNEQTTKVCPLLSAQLSQRNMGSITLEEVHRLQNTKQKNVFIFLVMLMISRL